MASPRPSPRLMKSLHLSNFGPVPSKEFKYFTIFLNEDKTNRCRFTTDISNTDDALEQAAVVKEELIAKLGKLIEAKIQAHSCDTVELFTGQEVIAGCMPTLVSVMFRLAAEDFVRNSQATFKIIECRNSTKLSSDWKPSLIDVVISLGHQVIVVELTDFPHYTDFVYSIIRQINYNWKIRLPRSFFYPDDVCEVDYSSDQQVVIVTPLMPVADFDFDRIQDTMKYEILQMIKTSCASGLKNHLLKRDLRVGRLSDTEKGVNSIRHIYRSLQQRLHRHGNDIEMGTNNGEDRNQFLLSITGDSLMSAQSYIDSCKNPKPEPNTPFTPTTPSVGLGPCQFAGSGDSSSIISKVSRYSSETILPPTDNAFTSASKNYWEHKPAERVKDKGDSKDCEPFEEGEAGGGAGVLDNILKAIKDLNLKLLEDIRTPSELEY